ncbi:HAD-IA family hydrolase [Candidatus Saccharibacteria bacterium]|nr:HAD-IA family hydrolase [Candidatus Saccharibacteria bacterium]
MSKYKAVGFDYGGVVFGEPTKKIMQHIRDHIGVTQEEWKRAWWQHNHKMNKGSITYNDVIKLVLHDLGKDEFYEYVTKTQLEAEQKQSISRDILDLADDLRRNGYKVGILSNMDKAGYHKIKALGLGKHFDVMDFSCNIGAMKPEPGAFLRLAHDLSVDIRELVFIDDNDKPLETAEEVGFKPILFENFNQLKSVLQDLNLLT